MLGLPALLFGAGGLSLSPPPLVAQISAPAAGLPDSTAFEFLSFRPGMSLVELREHAVQQGHGTLGCRAGVADPRLLECGGGLPELDSGRSVDIWASVINGRAAITLLSSRLTAARLDRWRALLEGRYGAARERRQGPARMLQWVRNGRMLRLTWRPKGRDFETSVSMIDGPLLDAWANEGKSRRN